MERWPLVVDEIRKAVGEEAYSILFKNLECLSREGSRLTLQAADDTTCRTLRMQYANVIDDAAKRVFGPNTTVDLRSRSATTQPAPAPRAVDPFLYSLNPQYTFENFITGPSNRLAHAAAVAVAGALGKAYNPLFIHSAVGLGKTHLVQAICHDLLQRETVRRIRYLSCESFINDFIHAVEQGDPTAFRLSYRQLDVLVIDDIQFLSKKGRTQEEFFHTFNTLYNAGKQIVLTSDGPPRDMVDLEERLLSRFKWGLVVPLVTPEYETRVAIIRRKARLRATSIPDDVIEYMAVNLETNIRELEGAIIKLTGYAALSGRSVDLDLAQEILGYHTKGDAAINMAGILDAVTKRFSIKLADLQSKRRTQSIVLPRQICMYLARQLTGHSLEEIGGFFGGRDHTTVLYAEQKIAKQVKTSGKLAAVLEELTGQIKQATPRAVG